MSPELKQRIEAEINKAPVMVFMKGDPDFPMCGFSAQVAKVFSLLEQDFHHVNVLEDEEIRQGIKEYSEWPTIPQVYINGEFIGGCDITVEMFKAGELQQMLDEQVAA